MGSNGAPAGGPGAAAPGIQRKFFKTLGKLSFKKEIFEKVQIKFRFSGVRGKSPTPFFLSFYFSNTSAEFRTPPERQARPNLIIDQ